MRLTRSTSHLIPTLPVAALCLAAMRLPKMHGNPEPVHKISASDAFGILLGYQDAIKEECMNAAFVLPADAR